MNDAATAAAIAMMAAGGGLAVLGTRGEIDGLRRPLRDPDKVALFFRGFRRSIIGLAVAGIGAAWLWDQTWLLLLSLAIGFEETLESSLHLYAVTKGKDLRLGPRPRSTDT